MFRSALLLVVCLAVLTPARAQMSVTTIGATDASQCFVNAASEVSLDTDPCDAALKDPATTRRDRKKTLVNRGLIRNRAGDIESAIKDFDAALEIDETLAEAWLNRGNSWFLSGRLDDALTDYHRALELDVSEPWAAWYNIGLVHDVRDEREKAREAYRKSLELKPDFELSLRKLADRK